MLRLKWNFPADGAGMIDTQSFFWLKVIGFLNHEFLTSCSRICYYREVRRILQGKS